ncbi:MAG: hypothetical protein AB8I56_11610 [Anaerolineales bacterium]
MISCETGNPGDEIRKPVTDAFGRLASRAPRWYLDALNRERKSRKR